MSTRILLFLQVAGGLRKALDADWSADMKVIIFVADAPAHGIQYHAPAMRDTYPDGDPTGLDPATLLGDIARRDIDFYLMRCHSCVDTMAEELAKGFALGQKSDEQIFGVLDLVNQSSGPAPSPSLPSLAPPPACPGASPRPEEGMLAAMTSTVRRGAPVPRRASPAAAAAAPPPALASKHVIAAAPVGVSTDEAVAETMFASITRSMARKRG